MRRVKILFGLLTFVLGLTLYAFPVFAGTIDSLYSEHSPDSDCSLATSGSMAQGETFRADNVYLTEVTLRPGMSIPTRSRPILLGTDASGTPIGPVLWQGPDVITPIGDVPFYPNVPLTPGALYFVGLDYGYFTNVVPVTGAEVVLLAGRTDNPITDGQAWRYLTSGWDPFASGTDVAVRIVMGGLFGNGTSASCTQTALQAAINATESGGTITLNCGPATTITLSSPIQISSAVIINGGGNKIIFDGSGMNRLFEVNTSGVPLTLRGLTLQNGYANGNGGAIQSFGGQLTIENSTLANNYAQGSGGAIWSGHTTVTNSTLTNNTAVGDGGALWIGPYSLLRFNVSTISGNTAGGWAGGVYFDGYNGSSLIWYGSILAGNRAGSYNDCYSNGFYYSPVSEYGVLGIDRCGIAQNNNVVDVTDPMLGELADNGGPTPTRLPLTGSPAIGAGNPAGYSWITDQRGYTRKSPYDIGAVEPNPNSPPVLTPIGNRTVQVSDRLVITVTATDPDGNILTYSATNLPSGASFDPTTHTFRWTPKKTGVYQVTFTVTDNGLPQKSASETITITVGAINNPPVFNMTSKYTVAVGKLLQFNVLATDPDNNSIVYSSSNLPSGATLNASTGLFQWTPGQTGTYKVTFTATDNGTPAMSSSQTVNITVSKK